MLRKDVWLGTSWKMTKTLAEAEAYAAGLAAVEIPERVQVFVLPPLTALSVVRERLAGGPVLLGAQNGHWATEGAWTGEVSMGMLADAGATLVEIGHSERREHFGETDERVALKVRAALDHGLVPLVCFGEPQAVRDAGDAERFVVRQVLAAVEHVDAGEVAEVLFAYEPIWAIGSAGRPATAAEVDPVLEVVARALTARGQGAVPTLLYGGSVTVENAADLLRGPRTDGLFVGRGAWDVGGLLDLVAICEAHVEGSAG